MLCSPADHPNPCCASWGPQTSSRFALTTYSTEMLNIIGDTGSPCVTTLCVWKGCPKNFPAFGTTFCSSQYHCSNLYSLGPRPYPLIITMHIPLSKEPYDFHTSINTWKIGLWTIPPSCCARFASIIAFPPTFPFLKP